MNRKALYLLGVLVSSFGGGLVLPITGIYILLILKAPVEVASIAYLLMGLLGILANPFSIRALGYFNVIQIFIFGIFLQALGFAVVAVAGSQFLLVIAGIALTGIGNGVVFTTRPLVLRNLFGENEITDILASQNIMVNLAIGVGAAISALSVHKWGESSIRALFVFNSLTYIFLAFIVWQIRRIDIYLHEGVRRLPRWSQVLHAWGDRRFLPLILIQLFIGLFAISQFDSVIPVILSDSPAFSFNSLGLLFFSNCLGVVVMQPIATRLIKRHGHMFGLFGSLVVWMSCFMTGIVLPDSSTSSWWWAIILGIWFAAGEILYVPSAQPLAIRAARGSESLPSYVGTAGLMSAIAAMLGPSIGFIVSGFFPTTFYWLFITIGIMLSIGIFLWLWKLNPDLQRLPKAEE